MNGVTLQCGCWAKGFLGTQAGVDHYDCDDHGPQLITKCNVEFHAPLHPVADPDIQQALQAAQETLESLVTWSHHGLPLSIAASTTMEAHLDVLTESLRVIRQAVCSHPSTRSNPPYVVICLDCGASVPSAP